MIVRLIDEKDVQKNSDVLKVLIENCINSTYELEDIHSFSENKIMDLKQHIGNHSAYPIAAFERNRMIGFLWGYETNGMSGRALHIAYISVLERFRGQGIAKSLIQYAEKVAENEDLAKVELIVGANNSAALSLYKSMNFLPERLILSKSLQE